MTKVITQGTFPSQAVPDAEKASLPYGLQIAKAIESEWFKKESGSTRYFANRDNFHRLRLYARGEQSIQKYKDELSINGDLSYLNLDWKPVPIIPKFVDIVVNGIGERTYDIKAIFGNNILLKYFFLFLTFIKERISMPSKKTIFIKNDAIA